MLRLIVFALTLQLGCSLYSGDDEAAAPDAMPPACELHCAGDEDPIKCEVDCAKVEECCAVDQETCDRCCADLPSDPPWPSCNITAP